MLSESVLFHNTKKCLKVRRKKSVDIVHYLVPVYESTTHSVPVFLTY